jgi:hypothetical protein
MKMKGFLFFIWAVVISFLTIKNTTSITKLEVDRSFRADNVESAIQSLSQTVFDIRKELSIPTHGNFE